MLTIHKKHLILGIIGFLIFAGLGGYGFMHYSLIRIEKEITHLERNLKKQGFQISHSPLKFTHGLFSLKATLPHLHLKTPEGALTWKNPHTDIVVHVWDPKTIHFDIQTAQHLLFAEKTLLPIRHVILEKTQGTLILTSSGAPSTLSTTIGQVIPMVKGKAHSLSLQNLSLRLSPLSTPLTLSIEASSHIGGLESFLHLSSSSTMPTLSLKAQLAGFQGPLPGPHSLAEWRDGGGVVDIKDFLFAWNPLEITAEGTITVDKDLYPLGSFSSHIKGYEEGLEQLVKTGLINKQNAAMGAFFLNMLSQSNEKGDKSIKVPLTIQDRHLSLGSIPLIQIK